MSITPLRDNILSLLNLAQQQSMHWSTMITTLMGFIIVLNGALWSYFLIEYITGDATQPTLMCIPSAISAVTLGLWRLYTRYLDNQIAHLYSEILYYEVMLSTPHNSGVSGYLCRHVPFIESIITSKLEPLKKAEAIESLAKAKRIGNRGHALIDLGVLGFIVFTLVASVFAFWWVFIHKGNNLELYNGLGYVVCLILILFGILLVFFALHNQRNPSRDLITKVISDAQEIESPR